jgi:hypothetical protein
MIIIKFVVDNVSFDSLMPLPSVLHRGHNTECSNNYADNVTNGRAFGLHTASAKATDRPIQPAKSSGSNWINGSVNGHDPLKTWDSKQADPTLTILKVPASSNKIKDQAVLDLAKSLDKEAAGVDGKASEKVRKKGHHNYSNGENHFQSRNSPPSFVNNNNNNSMCHSSNNGSLNSSNNNNNHHHSHRASIPGENNSTSVYSEKSKSLVRDEYQRQYQGDDCHRQLQQQVL